MNNTPDTSSITKWNHNDRNNSRWIKRKRRFVSDEIKQIIVENMSEDKYFKISDSFGLFHSTVSSIFGRFYKTGEY